MSEPILSARNLQKAYGKRAVLKGVTLNVPRGVVVGLVGSNGAGKSTFLKCLLGLLRPTAGSIRLLGEEGWELTPATKAKIGYVPQTNRLYPWFNVSQMIAYTAAFYPAWDEGLVTRLIAQSGLDPKQRVSSLSTGQAQRLSIILALGHQPEVLILDEPAASLDPLARREVLTSLLEAAQNENRTILFSTHIMSDLERVASHVALLRDGQIDLFEELDSLKDRVKRLRVSANHDLPHDLAIPGSLRTQVDGHFATVAVNHATAASVADLEHRWQASIEVEDLNLEEIYLELNHR